MLWSGGIVLMGYCPYGLKVSILSLNIGKQCPEKTPCKEHFSIMFFYSIQYDIFDKHSKKIGKSLRVFWFVIFFKYGLTAVVRGQRPSSF